MLTIRSASTEPIAGHLEALLRRYALEVVGQVVDSSHAHHATYVQRLRTCFEYHRVRFAQSGPIAPEQVIARLERGELGARRLEGNVLREVVVAQALELGEPAAARLFDAEYMPVVRAIARSLGGPRAEAELDNFAAELILPREGNPPRIALFHGRTTLRQWLGPVAANAWRTEGRRRRPELMVILPEPAVRSDPAEALDGRDCSGLLSPIFVGTCRLLEPEDRLLLQMLVLDGVAQKDVARGLGLNSGTITRRRQRAAAALLEGVRRLAGECPNPRQAAECLELVLAGDDSELRGRLAEVLAGSVRGEAGLTH